MPMNFPDAPTNGATFTSGGSTWVWTVPPSVWKAATTPSGMPLYLPLSGGTISGNLAVNGTTTLATATAPTVATADSSTNIATTAWVRAQGFTGGSGVYLPLTGGTLTGLLTLSSSTLAALNYVNTTTGLTNTTGGLWHTIVGPGGRWWLEMNTAAAGDFSTAISVLSASQGGGLALGATPAPADAEPGMLVGDIYSGRDWGYNGYYTGSAWKYLTTNTASLLSMGPGGTITFYGAPSAAAGAALPWTGLVNITPAGNLVIAGSYYTFQNAAASGVNTTGGPFFYGDTNWIIAHAGAGNGGFQVQSASGAGILLVFANATTASGNTCTVIPNGTWYSGYDTTGAGQHLLTMWTDNNIYLSETNRVLHLRGSSVSLEGPVSTNGNMTVAGSLTINGSGTIYSDGSSRLYSQWAYRAPALWADNDCNCNRLVVAGGVLYNRGDGWFGFNQVFRVPDFFSDGNVNTSGALMCNGVQWNNSGGNMHTPQSCYSDGEFCAGGAVWVSARAYYWNNTSGWMYSNGSVMSAGHLRAESGVCYITGGQYLQATGGYNYMSNVILNNGLLPNSNNSVSDGLTGNAYAQMAAYWFNNPSDIKLKQDIERIPDGALASVMALSAMRYRYRRPKEPLKHNPYGPAPVFGIAPVDPRVVRAELDDLPVTDMSDEPLRYGFLAQDVRNVMGEKFGGWRDDDGLQALSYNDLMAVLWQAVRELAAEVAALKGR